MIHKGNDEMNKNIYDLVPKNKFDIETVAKLNHYPFETIKAIIPSLLEWLQDMNWPVAQPIALFLVSIHEQITDEILEVFKSKDDIWKYWIISIFGPVTTSIEIRNEIKRIAKNPTKNEHLEALDELSLEIVKSRKWDL